VSGIPLTDAERTDLERRRTLKAKDRLVVSDILASRPDIAAGYYADPGNDGRLTVLSTKADPDFEAAIRERAEHPDRVVFKPAKYSTAQLDEFQRRITAGADKLGITISSIGALVPVGRVVIEVAGSATAAQSAIAELVPPDAVIVRQDVVAQAVGSPFLAGITTEAAPPWRGGMTIARPSGATGSGTAHCQSGFIAQKDEPTGPDSYWVMTAGHCGGIDTDWRATAATAPYSSGYGIGRLRGRCYAAGCAADVSVIFMNQSYDTNTVWLSAGVWLYITSQQGQSGDDVGDSACENSSQRGSYLCGTITQVSLDVTTPEGFVFPYMRRTDIKFTRAGDSGGSVFWNAQALGIVYGTSGSGDIYSHIWDAIHAVGMRAVKQAA
jgi:hypothetical protein